jgi:DNA mismatch endonuclease, patch repair protein
MTPEQRSRAMKRVKLKNGPLEILLQQELRKRRVKFGTHAPNLPGKPDIFIAQQKVAIFVDGDFWHGWRLPSWEHKLSAFWREKIRANRRRDLRNFRKLRAQGWEVLRIWSHQITRDLPSCILRIGNLLENKQLRIMNGGKKELVSSVKHKKAGKARRNDEGRVNEPLSNGHRTSGRSSRR